MIRFDDTFKSMEHYLWNVYSQLTGKFTDECKKHPEVEGHTFDEIKDICPEVYETFQDVSDFLEYTEKYLGYAIDHDNNTFKYIG